MKSLLPAALTPEDFSIISGATVQSIERTLRVEFMYRAADRRDADLMWRLSTYTMRGHLPVIHALLRMDQGFHLQDLLPFAQSSFIEIGRRGAT